MKFFSAIAALGLLSAVSATQPSAAEAKAVCGDLGVMNVGELKLPEGVDPTAIRTCKEHPEGGVKGSLEKRDCWHGNAPVGCSKNGYCYKACGPAGSGEWCWTALNGGFGDWKRCNTESDCSTDDACGAGDCDACGCSCEAKALWGSAAYDSTRLNQSIGWHKERGSVDNVSKLTCI